VRWLFGTDVLTWNLLLFFSALFFCELFYILVAFFPILGSFDDVKVEGEKCFSDEITHCAAGHSKKKHSLSGNAHQTLQG
jgi:hypothetical protein